MSSDQRSREGRPADVRPKRRVRPPAWLEDYDVSLPHYDQPSPAVQTMPPTTERVAEMTPLTHHTVFDTSTGFRQRVFTHSGQVEQMYESTPVPHHSVSGDVSSEILEAIQQLKMENQKLQSTVLDMQQQMRGDTSVPLHQQSMPPSHDRAPSQSWRLPRANLPYSEQPTDSYQIQPHSKLTWNVSRAPIPHEEEDWPPPPPPVADDIPLLQTAVNKPLPPPPTAAVPDLVEELTACLCRLGRTSHPPSCPATPEYFEPDDGSSVASDVQRAHDTDRQSRYPPIPPHVSMQYRKETGEEFHNPQREKVYRGPKPTIPDFTKGDPREFARLKISLDNILPEDATERFKYQILLDHLKFEDALLIADSYTNSKRPYSDTMASLAEHYGQPHQLALHHIADLMEGLSIRSHDTTGFKKFALKVRALVGMLDQLGESGNVELQCGSHVTRLLSKLPQDLRADFKRYMYPLGVRIPTLLNFAEWLEYELTIQESGFEFIGERRERPDQRKGRHKDFKSSKTFSIFHSSDPSPTNPPTEGSGPSATRLQEKVKAYCPYCSNTQHYLNQCQNFSQLTKEQKNHWVKTNKKCWRCGRTHQAAQCRLKTTCKICKGRHLDALHELNDRPIREMPPLSSPTSEVLYLDRQAGCSQVLLKVTKVILRHGEHVLETFAILDDGSERTILLQAAAQKLDLRGKTEDLVLRTVRQDMKVIRGNTVSFSISPACQPQKVFKINRAFTADQLGLAEHTYPIKALQIKYNHLRGLPIPALDKAHPLLLIGSDYPHLITPIAPVLLGPSGGPAAVRTRLGWTVQGPAKLVHFQLQTQQCLNISIMSPSNELFKNVQQLWQLDVLPYRNEKLVTRSKQDQDAVNLLEAKTKRIDINGIQRYATPLLRVKHMPKLQTTKEAVMANLRNTENRLMRDPQKAEAYHAEIRKLEQAGFAVKVQEQILSETEESWFIPHHMVSHNGKNRVVFNCSFSYKGQNLNDLLLPGPNLGSSLLGVLLRFREHTVAISSDIKGMFHQVRLLPEYKPLLRFLWRNLDREKQPDIYEWQVLPFGTTCSPCCATYALQRHVYDHSHTGDQVRDSIERSFYVDNCLQSLASLDEAKLLVDSLRDLLATGGFELRQWASNIPDIICHLPKEARSESSELWLNQTGEDPQEFALGLRWLCHSDTLKYKCRLLDCSKPTMRNIYKVVASQYDPLGFIVPYTTRAKILIQHLWAKHREWDDPLLPEDLLQTWHSWQGELQHLSQIHLPRCYVSQQMDVPNCTRQIHVFCDASEKAYGSVAYLRTENPEGGVEVSFLTARSRVAPKRQLSMPRLELCAALTGAQLASLVNRELTLNICSCFLWTDSTTVLTWLQSESCRFKVFVGTRVAEIQELTNDQTWRYVDSTNNPADDITRGKTLVELATDNRWRQGPAFLWQPQDHWPITPDQGIIDSCELRKSICCTHVAVAENHLFPDPNQYNSFKDLIEAAVLLRHGAAGKQGNPTADDYKLAEADLLRKSQQDSFPEDFDCLAMGRTVPSSSRLITLAPEYDSVFQLIRVGGRLRRSDQLDPDTIHPVVLDPAHKVTQLLIQDMDHQLCHPGSERVFAELRRRYWILRGRAAVKKQQHSCFDCQKWRAKPVVPLMADLPQARLQLFKPAFFSTGMDCFGPFTVKVGRRNEKRWGILFKCLTTRAVHIDLLHSLDTDSFLMALRRFISRRGKPSELLSDQGTNFKGGERELQEAFKALNPSLQAQLAKEQIQFKFNPPSSPHFGGAWEREIRSIKSALYATLQSQSMTEEVLRTVLIEVEEILNSKPLGYVSTDVADPNPVTPNLLLMGRLDPSLPQAVYHESELLSRRRWKHMQVLADQFWRQFIKYYLPNLQTRSKWQKDTDYLQPGMIVMILDPQLPRALWPVGQITNVFPGADGRVRTAEVKIKDRIYTRPAARLIKLPSIHNTDKTDTNPSK